MTATIDLDIASLDRIDFARPHREETRDLACKLSPLEYEGAGDAFAKAVRVRETLELEAQQEAKRRKGLIEAALGEERRLLKILETHSEERPTKVKELWAKRNGEDVLVAVRLDLFSGYIDSLCYVGTRYPQPMDRQTTIKAGSTPAKPSATGPSEEALLRQADAALASAEPLDGEPLPFEDEEEESEDRSVVSFLGAAEPETEASDSKPAKRSRKARAATTAAKAAKEPSASKAEAKPKSKGKAKA